MPLLRYEVGDLAETIANNCSCGLPFPVLDGLVGRAADLFPLPDGRVVHGQILIAYMSGLPNIERFQFRQTRKDRLNLYVVKSPGFGFQSARELDRIGKRMRTDLNIPLQIEFVDQIPLTGGGKFRSTVCEVKT
jgi:phenylacetate-CoA ligase